MINGMTKLSTEPPLYLVLFLQLADLSYNFKPANANFCPVDQGNRIKTYLVLFV